MNGSPKVSIIIPLYNRVSLVGQTLDSVINQTYENWEAIVVDDGSNDGSYEYVQDLAQKESRIKVFKRYREPKGACVCRNIGIEKSSGDFIIFLDSDDLLAPHCLQQRIQAFLDHQDQDFLVFPVQYFENEIGDREKIFFRYFYEDYLTSFLLQSHWITISPIWKKEAVIQLNGFDENLTCMQDGELHWRALVEGMKFKVFKDKELVDSYLRHSYKHARISTSLTSSKLDSKVYAHQKIYSILQDKGLLTPIRSKILAAQFLNISWKYKMIGEGEKSNRAWKIAREYGMVDDFTYFLCKTFIKIRSSSPVKDSNILAGGVKRIYQLFLPKFLLWPK